MNILYSTHTSPDYMPPLAISTHQIIVGPNYPNRTEGKTVRTLNVPAGRYDLAALAASLPTEQQPDLTIVLVDAYRNCLPERLIDVPGRKLLLIADTHHGKSPLQNMLAYARGEAFDRIVVTHDPHHLHWFTEADIAPTTYIPNVNCAYFPQRFVEQRRPGIIFVGQTGSHHLRRNFLLSQIRQAGLPLIVQQAPAPVAASLYNSTQISFNCSLNGDLNMRVFEVMGAAGFLVTDRLSPQSTLDALFHVGDEYVEYNNVDELLELLRYYLAHSKECLTIARAGHKAYTTEHNPKRRIAELLDFAFGAAPIAPCNDPRALTGSYEFGDNLNERVRLYELFQNLSRQNERLVVLADIALGPRVISDLVDLPRLQILIDESRDVTAGFKETLRQLGVLNQIKFVDTSTVEYDIQLLHAQTIDRLNDAQSLRCKLVALMPDGSAITSQLIRLATCGFRRVDETSWLFKRAN